jgi:kinetochore protein Spc7/SPC105
LPATRRSRRSIGGQSPKKTSDKENATIDIGSTSAASRKKSRSKSIGPGGLDGLKPSAGNRRVVSRLYHRTLCTGYDTDKSSRLLLLHAHLQDRFSSLHLYQRFHHTNPRHKMALPSYLPTKVQTLAVRQAPRSRCARKRSNRRRHGSERSANGSRRRRRLAAAGKRVVRASRTAVSLSPQRQLYTRLAWSTYKTRLHRRIPPVAHRLLQDSSFRRQTLSRSQSLSRNYRRTGNGGAAPVSRH